MLHAAINNKQAPISRTLCKECPGFTANEFLANNFDVGVLPKQERQASNRHIISNQAGMRSQTSNTVTEAIRT